MDELKHLREIVFSGTFDAESRRAVTEWEERLQTLAAKEKLLDNPVIKEYRAYLLEQIKNARLLLSTDRTLTDRQRDSLFERIDICDGLLNIFTGERAGLESKIREALALAKAI